MLRKQERAMRAFSMLVIAGLSLALVDCACCQTPPPDGGFERPPPPPPRPPRNEGTDEPGWIPGWIGY
jgi:hypothetical protein